MDRMENATSVMKDGTTTLLVKYIDLIPLGAYVMIASSGDTGRIQAKRIDAIIVIPNDFRKWVSMPDRKIVKEGEIILWSIKPFEHGKENKSDQGERQPEAY